MADNLDKLASIRARCTPYAREFLVDLHSSPHFFSLLDELMEMPGLITHFDIERALLEISKRKE